MATASDPNDQNDPTPEEIAKLKAVEIAPTFATAFHVQATGNDFTILFQRARSLQTEVGIIAPFAKVEVVAAISMSPQSLKDMVVLLQGQIESYEKDFGEIQTNYTRKKKKK